MEMSQHSGYLDEMPGGGGVGVSSSLHLRHSTQVMFYTISVLAAIYMVHLCVSERIHFSEPKTWGTGREMFSTVF
jgi:hypothetical protein